MSEIQILKDMAEAAMLTAMSNKSPFPVAMLQELQSMIEEALTIEPSSFRQSLDFNDDEYVWGANIPYRHFFDRMWDMPLLMNNPDPIIQLAVKWRFSIGH